MCPKMKSNMDCEQDISLHEDSSPSSRVMSSAIWSIYQEERQDSGLPCMNFPSLNSQEIKRNEEIVSIVDSLRDMSIDQAARHCLHDSGVYISELCNVRQDFHNNDMLCESFHPEEDNVDTNNIPHPERTINGTQSQIIFSSEQVLKLFDGDRDGDNKLHLSIINGHQEFSLFIINLAEDYNCLSYCNRLRQTPLHLAVLTRQPTIVRRLICAGALVMAQNKDGDTPLHIACRLGDKKIIKHLLTPVSFEETQQNRYVIPYQRVPQDLRARNYDGQTCLHIAGSLGHYDVVQLLLEAGADVNTGDGKSGRSMLHQAADRGDIDLVEQLLAWSDVNVTKTDYAGFTPIELAFGRKHIDIVHAIYGLSLAYDGVDLSDLEISCEDDTTDDSDTSDCSDCASEDR